MLSPYAWLAAGLVVLATLTGTFWKGYVTGKEHVQEQWDADKAARIVAENKAIAKRIEENAAIATKNNADRVKLKRGYENELTKVRADRDAAPGLRVSNALCEGFTGRAESGSPGRGTADASGSRPLPTALDRNLRDLMQQADEMLNGCRVAQQFITDQGMAQ